MRLDRSFFELQAAFARRAAESLDISETDAFRRFTTFYWVAGDNDAGRRPEEWSFNPAHPAWSAFSHAVQHGTDPIDYVYRHHLESLGADGSQTCFEYQGGPPQPARAACGVTGDGTCSWSGMRPCWAGTAAAGACSGAWRSVSAVFGERCRPDSPVEISPTNRLCRAAAP